MARIVETNVEQLRFDNHNFNKHTEYGMRLLEESIQRFGMGRSILIDKNDRIIAGNGIVETASQVGMEDVIVVETDGSQIVAVKRKDIDLDSPKGREMALADNATAKANLSWDAEAIMEQAEAFDFDPETWGVTLTIPEEEENEDEEGEVSARLIVECGDVTRLSELFSELQGRGFTVELKE